MESENIYPVLIGGLIYLLLIYFVIVAAVKSGTKDQTLYLKLLYRLKIKQLVKEGHKAQDLVNLEDQSNDDFWRDLGL